MPGAQLEGRTIVGERAPASAPDACCSDTVVGTGATVLQAVCDAAVIGPGDVVGPFAHLTGETERITAGNGS